MGVVSRRLAAVAATVVLAAVGGAGARCERRREAARPAVPRAGDRPDRHDVRRHDVGGLSSITYDRSRGVYYALSDDQSQFNPARFYTLRVNVADGHLDTGDVSFTGVTTLLAPGGGPYAPFSLDPEGLTLAKSGELIVTSEGIARTGSRRACGGTRSTGRSSATCRCRTRSCRRARRTACGRTSRSRRPPSLRTAVTCSSGWRARSHRTAPRRRSRTGARRGSSATTSRSGRLDRQYVYFTDPIAEAPVPPTSSRSTGSSSCCRSTTSSCSRWSARSRSARPARATRSSSTRSRSPARTT